MSKNIEKLVSALAMGKAVNVLEPHVVAIASACIAQSEAQDAAALERENAKAVKGKAYDHVRAAIVAAAEAEDVPVEALADAFTALLSRSNVPDNTIRPYSSTLKLAVPAIREGRVSLEQVESLQMNHLRDACRSDEEKELAALRKEIKETVTSIKVKKDGMTTAEAKEALSQILALARTLAPAKEEKAEETTEE